MMAFRTEGSGQRRARIPRSRLHFDWEGQEPRDAGGQAGNWVKKGSVPDRAYQWIYPHGDNLPRIMTTVLVLKLCMVKSGVHVAAGTRRADLGVCRVRCRRARDGGLGIRRSTAIVGGRSDRGGGVGLGSRRRGAGRMIWSGRRVLTAQTRRYHH